MDLLGRCGLGNRYISQLEKGLKTPTLDVVMRVSKAFGVTPEKLVREVRMANEEMGG